MMQQDPCLFVKDHRPDPAGDYLLKFLFGLLGLNKTPTQAAVLEAVREELEDQSARALEALEAPCATGGVAGDGQLVARCREALQRARAASSDPNEPTRAYFPRTELEVLLAEAAGQGSPALAPLSSCIAGHRDFEARLHWLLNGTSRAEAEALDPKRDCDRFYHYLSSEFRAEDRILDLISVNRIAQSETVSLFFHSTREAEQNPVYRFYDTFLVFANFIEWGRDSKRGRTCTQLMNRIHGRYFIPNAGMKYVLLQMPFTWIDGIERIGHRPLTQAEKEGYFHAYLRMGRTMHIQELSDDYEEMYAWYREFNAANREHSPIKRRMFETIVQNSLRGVSSVQLKEAAFLAARVAMEDTYRDAVGYALPTESEREAVRSAFRSSSYVLQFLPKQPWIRSLQDTPVRHEGYDLARLGVQDRSKWMPKATAQAANGGFPEAQKPINEAKDIAPMALPELDWSEVRKHDTRESLWVVIDGFVYDVTHWAALHPGGLPILARFAGKDASAAFHNAKHSLATQVFKLNYRIGRIAGAQRPATDAAEITPSAGAPDRALDRDQDTEQC